MSKLKLREEQVLQVTREDRESGTDDNPIVYAESGPCRYQSVTYWFPDGDGVIVEVNMDDEDDFTVTYMDGEESIELTDGPLYEWAVEQYEND